jgi:hypothetical protein
VISGTPIAEFVDDLEILNPVASGTCTDREELVWEYNGAELT